MTDQTKQQRSVIEADVTIAENMTHISLPLGKLKLSFNHGKTIEINTETLSPEILGQAILHGLKQKLVDAAAISRNPENGRAATPDDKFAAVQEVADRLTGANGEEPAWNKRREGGGNAGGLLFRALVRMYDGRKTSDQIKEWLDAKTDAQKAALRKNPDVARIIDEIRTEDGKGGDAGDLLAELEA
jgi:hypothetical protein